MVIMVVNLLIPVFYWGRLEARVTVIVFAISAILMMTLTDRSGFTRLLGLGHILFVPLMIFLVSRLSAVPVGNFYGFWLRLLIVVNLITLAFDSADVIRYWRGDRAELV
jgi:hypothetical protein